MKKVILLIVFSLILSGLLFSISERTPPEMMTSIIYPKAKPLPEFELLDQKGEAFTHQHLMKKWSLIFFGYTYCPDICPTTMAELAQLTQSLPAEVLDQLQIILVSVDYERDQPDRLADYVRFYHPDFIGLTGEADQLQTFSRSLGAMYMKVPSGDSYSMSHSNTIFIVNPDGQRHGIISRTPMGTLDKTAIAHDLKVLTGHY